MAYMAVEALGLPIELPQPVRRTTADTLKGDGDSLRPAIGPLARTDHFDPAADVTLYLGRCENLMASMPAGSAQLVVTSPPYNIGKAYERRTPLDAYIEDQKSVIAAAVRVLAEGGSICWQVGNHIDDGEVVPLDAVLYPIFKSLGLRLRNRIVWHFEHGLHASRRFSGRYETILWFTKGDSYYFDVDPVRVPQKYPNKRAFKGPRRGELTGNPLGKSPGDVWIIPNVKSNHIEKTEHPCQFPIELIERLVLSMTRPGDLVLDPYGGVGSAPLAALLHNRRAAMAELVPEYMAIAKHRLDLAESGELRARPMSRPVYDPDAGKVVDDDLDTSDLGLIAIPIQGDGR
jgi:adenine-specific DNA-methyltransferase